MIGAGQQSAIGTLVERVSRFVMLLHLPDDHGAESVQNAIVEKMSQLPSQLRRSLTWDQGIEMANHAAIAKAVDLDIYFCDPHSPWQRGTNKLRETRQQPNSRARFTPATPVTGGKHPAIPTPSRRGGWSDGSDFVMALDHTSAIGADTAESVGRSG